MTTDHLPECRYVVFQQQGQIPEAVIPMRCICAALRACEGRVREELFPQRWNRAEEIERAVASGWYKGWYAALDEAREAVWESVGPSADAFSQMVFGRALAAIDELRNPPSLPPTKGRAHKY